MNKFNSFFSELSHEGGIGSKTGSQWIELVSSAEVALIQTSLKVIVVPLRKHKLQ